jgi:hypothetical protein
MDWFIERLGEVNPTLDYHDLRDHEDDFKRLADLKIIKYFQQLDDILCDLCDKDHLVSPFRNGKGELIISCCGSRRVVNPDELKIWTINGGILAKNVNSKDRIITKRQLEQTIFALNNFPSAKRYADTSEPIKLPTLGIEIRGGLASKNGKEFKLNPTDKALVYSLYYRFLKNRDECSQLGKLASEISSDENKSPTEEYLENRITIINKEIKKLVTGDVTNIKNKITVTNNKGVKRLVTRDATNIPVLIKHEKRRGYHLNSKLFPGEKSVTKSQAK